MNARTSEAGKGKETGIPLEPSEGRQAGLHLETNPEKWTQSFGPPE